MLSTSGLSCLRKMRYLICVLFAAALVLPWRVAAQDTTSASNGLEELYWQRQEEARSRYVQAEVDFMTGMISHHAQALVMSAHAEPNGASPAVRVLAARIINAQKDEIDLMQTWLADRGEAVPVVHAGGHMPGHGHAHMPGMLSQAQLKELEMARGAEFDRLFLTYMIQHHQGAVTMVRELFRHDGVGRDEEAFKLASAIHVDQITEIERMELMLGQ